jgi:hypothetical protein
MIVEHWMNMGEGNEVIGRLLIRVGTTVATVCMCAAYVCVRERDPSVERAVGEPAGCSTYGG